MAALYLTDLTIRFNFSRNDDTHSDTEDFSVFDDSLGDTVDTHAEELLEALNDDLDEFEDEWGFDEFEVESYDDDWTDPDDFKNLNEYGAYAGLVEEFGEAYHLRYDDILNLDARSFQDSFRGTWESEEKYAQQFADDIGAFDKNASQYVDWESYARDILMDCSVYEGDEGYHIFWDC